MSTQKNTKRCLIISYGPVPTPEYQTVEGGGMRAWGLAEGLLSHSVDVTIGINASFPQSITEHDGIKLVNWNLDNDFIQLMNSFDAVIISYCMGDPSVFVAQHISDNVQLILDAYVPIYIEVSARDSKDIDTEYVNYMADINRHNIALRRGDYFLYANDAQELLYDGVLSALGVINPKSYREERLLKTPFGVHRTPVKAKANPYVKLGITKEDFVVLWFGGIYPWFRIEEYLDAIKNLSRDKSIKFVFVGGKNPFNPNPDFSRQYEMAVSFAKSHKLIDRQVFFVDWVDFQDRVDWFVHSDVIISLNQPGEENKFSWRTRVMDFVWGEAVTISNGGDPLSEELIESDAAIRLDDLSATSITKAIIKLHKDNSLLDKAKKNITVVKNRYYWDVVTRNLAKIIQSGTTPYRNEAGLRALLGDSLTAAPQPTSNSKLKKIVKLPIKVLRKVKQKGVIRSAKIGVSIAKTHLKRSTVVRQRQYVFISHPINNTGAPIVLLQIVEEYVKKYGANNVRLIAPGVDTPEQQAYINKLGIHVEQAVFGIDFRFIRLQLNLKPDDVVIMNTVAIYDNYRDFILLWLRLGRLKHAYWFIHEDIAQLPVIHKEFLDKSNLQQIKQLADDKKVSLLFPSKRTAQEFSELIGTSNIRSINLHVEVDKKYTTPRSANDFESIDFLLSGTSGDGRKGQLIAISAFRYFITEYQAKNPSKYRDFTLHLVAIGDEYISQQVKWIAKSLLGDAVKIYPSLPKDEAMEITRACNAVVCCSLNETFGLYIAEGMLMGHVLLRNSVAGVDEQLVDGENGYLIDHTDVKQIGEKIAALLDKKSLSNKQLLTMSKKSQQIVADYQSTTYIDQIES
jgi:glycosyltransferase involved in cell wall biosynthesis